MSIAQEHLNTLSASEVLLVTAFYSHLAYIIARLVVTVGLDVGRRHLCHITQQQTRIRVFILAYAALLDIEAREAVGFLLENAELLVGELRHKQLLCVFRIARVFRLVLDITHTAAEIVLSDIERATKLSSVQPPLLLVHHNHDVIRRLIVDQQFTIAVTYITSRRKLHFLQEGITIGIPLIVVTKYL